MEFIKKCEECVEAIEKGSVANVSLSSLSHYQHICLYHILQDSFINKEESLKKLNLLINAAKEVRQYNEGS